MFRLESTTPPTKKRHSARKQGREASQTASNATKSMQAFLRTSEELNAFPTTTEGTNQMRNLNAENIEEVFTIQPESSTRNTSKQRHRRHHRRRQGKIFFILPTIRLDIPICLSQILENIFFFRKAINKNSSSKVGRKKRKIYIRQRKQDDPISVAYRSLDTILRSKTHLSGQVIVKSIGNSLDSSGNLQCLDFPQDVGIRSITGKDWQRNQKFMNFAFPSDWD